MMKFCFVISTPQKLLHNFIKSKAYSTNFIQNVRFFTSDKQPVRNDVKDWPRSHKVKTVLEPGVADTLKKILACHDVDISKMCTNEPGLKEINTVKTKDRLKYLTTKDISAISVMEYPFLLLGSDELLNDKITTIQEIEPRNINDFVPFLTLEIKSIYKVKGSVRLGDKKLHWIYVFSKKMNIEPCVISKHFARRPDCILRDHSIMIERLDLLLKYIHPGHLLSNLGAFRTNSSIISERLDHVITSGIDSPRPWMVTCSRNKLDRMIQNHLEEKEASGNNENALFFFMEKLDLDIESSKNLLNAHPQLHSRRIRSVLPIIEYLLSETDYSKEDIVDCPRILYFSLNTIKERVEAAKSMGIRQIKLSSLAQSHGRFSITLQSITNKNKR